MLVFLASAATPGYYFFMSPEIITALGGLLTVLTGLLTTVFGFVLAMRKQQLTNANGLKQLTEATAELKTHQEELVRTIRNGKPHGDEH